MVKKRFIDLAVHGGCSKKLGAPQLRTLLSKLQPPNKSENTTFFDSWLDFGRYDFGEDVLVSNVDIILPMVLSPMDFGEIAVAHVLSDIYASGATPIFVLNIVGVSRELDSESSDLLDMLKAANEKLRHENIALVGGHTVTEQEDFYYGLAAVGIIKKVDLVTNEKATPGNILVLTKPLGTSVASISWKDNVELRDEFEDVLRGMKQLNKVAAQEMITHGATACTDITGFGLLGHMHNLLRASNVSAVIDVNKLPIYESVLPFIQKTHVTSLWGKNFEYVKDYFDLKVNFSPLLENILFDAQVSGGLLVSLPEAKVDNFINALKDEGITASVIGEIKSGDIGKIEILG